MIILHARVPIRSEARERWLALLDAVTPVARRRRLPEAIETPNTFIFVEEWASLDGLYAHFHTPHFIEFFAALGDVLAGPPAGAVSELSSTQTLDEAFAAAGIGG